MLMVKEEGGLGYRVAIGWIFKESIQNSFSPGPRWEEFAMA